LHVLTVAGSEHYNVQWVSFVWI